MNAIIKDDIESQLIEPGNVTDIYADGMHRIELLGDNIRIVYFRWKLAEDGMRWQKIGADFAFVVPARSFKRPLDEWAPFQIKGPPMWTPSVTN